MIEILPLVLGLLTGVQEVELRVEGEVAEVEVLLDFRSVTHLQRPLSSVEVDLGPELQPHLLVVIARDAKDTVLGRASRWINISGPVEQAPAEGHGTWRIPVAISIDDTTELPPIAGMQTWFVIGDRSLTALDVDDGPPRIVIVRDPGVQPELDWLPILFTERRLRTSLRRHWEVGIAEAGPDAFARSLLPLLRGGGEAGVNLRLLQSVWQEWREYLPFGDEAVVTFLSPVGVPASSIETPKQVLGIRKGASAQEVGILWQLVSMRPGAGALRIADAVAIAGLEAHSSHTPRVVLLVLGQPLTDESRYLATEVRDYLASLDVPLVVWCFGADHPDWGPALTLDLQPKGRDRRPDFAELLNTLEEASLDLRRSLAAQRVVWLQGSGLPQQVRLREGIAGVRLVRSTGADSSPFDAQ